MWQLHYKENWARRINAFELWGWRRLLRVPWTARRSNQSILREVSPECSLEGLMLKLRLQYFGQLMQRTDSFEKTLMLGKIWRQEEKKVKEDEMVGWHHRLNGLEFEQALGVGDGQRSLACCIPWVHKESDTTELNWTCGSAGKESTCNARDLGLIPGLGRSLREAKVYPLKYSGEENSMDYIVHGDAKSQTWLSDFHFHEDHWETERTCNNRN